MRKVYLALILAGLFCSIPTFTSQAQLYTIQYDDGNPYYYSGRPRENDTCGVWFEPPSECRLISASFYFYSAGDAEVYVWSLVDNFDPDNYFDSDEPNGSPGPSPLDSILFGPIPYYFSGSQTWEEIVFSEWGGPPSGINVRTNNFFVGYVLHAGGTALYDPSIMGDISDPRPYHSLAWLTNPGGLYPNQSGWWAYGIDWMLRATVDIYGDPPPTISDIEDPPDTYLPGPYTIEATITDLEQGGQPGQVTGASLVYTVGAGDTMTVSMTNIGGNLWQGNIPTVPVLELVTFHVEATDNGGLTAVSSDYYFTYRQPSGATMLLVNDYAEGGEEFYVWALDNLGVDYDYWLIDNASPNNMGYPGFDVIDTSYYSTIIWFTGTADVGSLPDNDANLDDHPICQFMDDGGNFFLSSSDYLGGAFNPDDWDEFTAIAGTFMYEYLHVLDGWSDSHLNPGTGESMDTMYIGVPADPVGEPFSASYFQNHPSPNYNDFANPRPNAFTSFRTQIDDESAAIRYGGNYKMIFLPWVLEACDSWPLAQDILQGVLEYFSTTGSLLQVNISPLVSPVIIPSAGGSFLYTISVTNNDVSPQTTQGWIMVRQPNGSWYGPVLGPISLTLPGGITLTRLRTQNVPGWAPAGEYTYTAYIGTYASMVVDSSYFGFRKLGIDANGSVGDWSNSGEPFDEFLVEPLPDHFALFEAFPNPFNSSTILSYQLPAASWVKMEVHDVTGRLVAKLIDGQREAGEHRLNFDGANLPSGVYVYHLQAGDQKASGKMVLLK